LASVFPPRENFLYCPFSEIGACHGDEVGMKGDYPRFKATYTHDELVEHFLLSPADHAMVETCYGDANRHSVAVLLKSLHYLGYFPSNFQQVPPEVRTFIAQQLQLLWDCTAEYPWHSRTRDRHLALIRSRAGFRFPTSADGIVKLTVISEI
jgi:hypothetical protein